MLDDLITWLQQRVEHLDISDIPTWDLGDQIQVGVLVLVVLILLSLAVRWMTKRRRSDPRTPPGSGSWKPAIHRYEPVRSRGGAKRPKLVLFIHGLKGSQATSFGAFPKLLSDDKDIAATYDIAAFDYKTALLAVGGAPHPSDVARELKTVIDYDFDDYAEIVIIAHSMGGLITRRYIADVLLAGQPLKVSRVIYFATPHLGALAAKLGSIGTAVVSAAVAAVPGGGVVAKAVASVIGAGPSEQVEALGYDSRFLLDLMQDEAHRDANGRDARDRVSAKFVLASNDIAVGKSSGWGPGGPTDFEVVPNTDHSSLVSPTSTEALSFKIARHVLLATDHRPPWAADPDQRQPNLQLKISREQTDTERKSNRFIFWNRALPFIGRDSEQHALAAFLGDPQRRFRWLLISGPGGMGKSRLALELVLAQASGWWNAGFIDPKQQSAPDWALWQPRLATLMIIDYAGRDATSVASLLKGLAERESPHLLRYPVRVVVVERDAKGPWLDTITGASRIVAGETARAADLPLQPITDVWPIFEHLLGPSAAAKAGRHDTLAKLSKIDKAHRPLFAYLMADAMRQDRVERHWDRAALLEDVIARERRDFWRPVAKDAGFGDTANAIAREERALALATMAATSTQPLTREELDACRTPLLPTWDIDCHPQLFAAMTGGGAPGAILPMEPDIVGEFFVLETLRALERADARVLVQHAWRTRPEWVWWFVSRCATDFPDHSCFPLTHEIAPENALIAENWAKAAFNLIYQLGAADLPAARRLHGEMQALAAAHGTEPALRENWAKAAANLIIDLRAADLPAARGLHGEMQALAAAHGTEPALREAWAKAAVNLIYQLGAADLPAARRLHGEMQALAAAHGTEPALREAWAKAAVNLIIDLGAADLPAARGLHGEMQALAASFPAEAVVQEALRRASTALGLGPQRQVIQIGEGDLAQCQATYLLISQMAGQTDGSSNLAPAWVAAFAALLTKAAEDGKLDDVLRSVPPPPPAIGVAAQVLILRRTNRGDEAAATLAAVRADWPAEIATQVEEILGALDQPG